jgi:hypothetical protein
MLNYQRVSRVFQWCCNTWCYIQSRIFGDITDTKKTYYSRTTPLRNLYSYGKLMKMEVPCFCSMEITTEVYNSNNCWVYGTHIYMYIYNYIYIYIELVFMAIGNHSADIWSSTTRLGCYLDKPRNMIGGCKPTNMWAVPSLYTGG